MRFFVSNFAWMRSGFLLLAVICLTAGSGCTYLLNRWPDPEIANRGSLNTIFNNVRQPELASAESAYSHAIDLESRGCPSCVDYYFVAATCCWQAIESQNNIQCVNPRALGIYHSSLRKILICGQRFHRFNPKSGLTVQFADRVEHIPIRFHGFVWKPEDFDYVEPIGHYLSKDLTNIYRCRGLGISSLATHCRRPYESFRKETQRFGCTVLLRPNQSGENASGFSFEFLNPLRVASTNISGRAYPITRDKSATIAYSLINSNRNELKEFIHAGATAESDGLYMFEPYQPDKIPLIFVHGLLSNRLTWANLANEIVSCPALLDRYQIWAFEYATGEPFLESAAVLRRQLTEIKMRYDATGQNVALHRTVLVGHSMGGLVSKLMISDSSECLWRSISRCPIDSICTDNETRSRLSEAFFFQPHDIVERVVYIGTPHKGAPLAGGPLGRIGSSLVEQPSNDDQRHDKLISENPCVFTREFSKRIPTSVDLLRPESRLLQAIDSLTVRPNVRQHSIIGIGYPTLGAFNSDGVVPARSSFRDDVETHLAIRAKHTQLHKNERSVAEVLAILRRHLYQP